MGLKQQCAASFIPFSSPSFLSDLCSVRTLHPVMTSAKKHCVPDKIRTSCLFSLSVTDEGRWTKHVPLPKKHCPRLLLPPYRLARALCLHCSSAPCGSAMPSEQKQLLLNSFDKVGSLSHFTLCDRMLNERILSRFYGLNGFGKAF